MSVNKSDISNKLNSVLAAVDGVSYTIKSARPSGIVVIVLEIEDSYGGAEFVEKLFASFDVLEFESEYSKPKVTLKVSDL